MIYSELPDNEFFIIYLSFALTLSSIYYLALIFLSINKKQNKLGGKSVFSHSIIELHQARFDVHVTGHKDVSDCILLKLKLKSQDLI